MELSKFLALYHGGVKWVDGDGVEFAEISEHTLEDVCQEYAACKADKRYLAAKVTDAKMKGIISTDTVVE
jgi:hypothetical protein